MSAHPVYRPLRRSRSGLVLSRYLLGVAAGPLAMTYGYDILGSYKFVIRHSVRLIVLSCILMLGLRRYWTLE